MHVRFNRSLRGDYGKARVGDIKMVPADVGKSLIQRGLAEEVPDPASTQKKAKGGDRGED